MKKKTVRIAVFLLLLCFLGGMFSLTLRKYWSFQSDYAATSIAQGFYELKEDTLDVLYIGASSMRNGISPLYMWRNYGITGYVRGTSQQSVLCSYYLLRESLRYQKNVKVVVMDASVLLYNEGNDFEDLDVQEPYLHEVTDNMRMGADKLSLIRDIVNSSQGISFLDLLSPLYRYHDRWSELQEDDFLYSLEAEYHPYKGQYPAYTTTALAYADDYMLEGVDDPFAQVNPKAIVYFEKMKELCDEKSIEMVLVKTPNTTWKYEKSQAVLSLASDYDIPVLDYNLPELRAEIGINEKTDFADGSAHLNIYGANKVCGHLGMYLMQNYQLLDKRGLPDYSSWEEDYQCYLELQRAVEIVNEGNLVEYLKKADNPNYIVAIAGRYDLAKKYNEDIWKMMQAIGLKRNLTDCPYMSYIALVDGGRVVAEKLDKEVISESYNVGGLNISLSSGGKNIPDMHASILIDHTEQSSDGMGFNIVIYDKILQRVISSRAFNTSKTGVNYAEREAFAAAESLEEYLTAVNSRDYYVAVTISPDSSYSVSDQALALWRRLGGSVELDEALTGSYAALIEEGKVVEETIGQSAADILKLEVEKEFLNGDLHTITVTNRSAGNDQKIVYDGETQIEKGGGISFLVIDKYNGSVRNCRSFCAEE